MNFLRELLAQIDWTQLVSLLLAALGGGATLNVATKQGWFGRLTERFRGKPADRSILQEGLDLVGKLDELFKLKNLPVEQRKEWFADLLKDLFPTPPSP